jgi:hypothetical protein
MGTEKNLSDPASSRIVVAVGVSERRGRIAPHAECRDPVGAGRQILRRMVRDRHPSWSRSPSIATRPAYRRSGDPTGPPSTLGEETIDGSLKVGDRFEDSAPQSSSCELGEEAFDGVKPGPISG